MPRVTAMLEARARDRAAVSEPVEAEVAVEGGCLPRLRLRRHLLLLHRGVTSGTRRSSLSCSCKGYCAAAFVFPGRLRGCWRSTSHRG